MKVMAGPEIEWLSTKEACERLGVTLRTLYRLMDEGQLPGYKIGRLIRSLLLIFFGVTHQDLLIGGAR